MEKKEIDTMKRLLEQDDAPAWTDDVFERAELREGDEVTRPASGTLTRRGRPKLENPKRQVTLRLDPEVLNYFRSTGRGWQSRINSVLKKAVGKQTAR
ncbi:MAG TPA: BrnA antitoxin family protein [Caulobacteraceae bacterium]